MLQRQCLYPKLEALENSLSLKSLGRHSGGQETVFASGNIWSKYQVHRHPYFLLITSDAFSESESTGYTRQEDYIKFNFWLSGKHTTVLNGFGQYEHQRPEVFITAGPRDMVKMDLTGSGRSCFVALCVLPDFFTHCLGMAPDALPPSLNNMLSQMRLQHELPFMAEGLPMNNSLLAAAHSVLAAPAEVRQNPLYAQAKAIDLMCLLIQAMEQHSGRARHSLSIANGVQAELTRFYTVRDFIDSQLSQALSLSAIAKASGMNKTTLSRGFKQHFGLSVFDYVLKERMQKAYQLLREQPDTVEEVAAAVGYRYQCNFSTAFRRYFGCAPKALFASDNDSDTNAS